MILIPKKNEIVFTEEARRVYETPEMRQHIEGLLERPEVIAAIASLRFHFEERNIRVELQEWSERTFSALEIMSAKWEGNREQFLARLAQICQRLNVAKRELSGLEHELWRRVVWKQVEV